MTRNRATVSSIDAGSDAHELLESTTSAVHTEFSHRDIHGRRGQHLARLHHVDTRICRSGCVRVASCCDLAHGDSRPVAKPMSNLASGSGVPIAMILRRSPARTGGSCGNAMEAKVIVGRGAHDTSPPSSVSTVRTPVKLSTRPRRSVAGACVSVVVKLLCSEQLAGTATLHGPSAQQELVGEFAILRGQVARS